MLIDENTARDLVAALRGVREALERPQTPFDRLLTIGELCERWRISKDVFHQKPRKELPICGVIHDPRYRLSDVVRYEQRQMKNADGSPLDPELLKRPARRRGQAAGTTAATVVARIDGHDHQEDRRRAKASNG
jgi:hypothetical protein